MESVRAVVEPAVRAALGDRLDRGNWLLTLRFADRDRNLFVDLSNRDGFVRQWLFAPGAPITEFLRGALGGA
jgi:hypothetical protein